MLEITNLSKSYKKNQVLKDTNITVNDGEMVALLGPSGSGKTTILRIVAGFIESNGGDVKIDGKKHIKSGGLQKKYWCCISKLCSVSAYDSKTEC